MSAVGKRRWLIVAVAVAGILGGCRGALPEGGLDVRPAPPATAPSDAPRKEWEPSP